MVTYRSSTVLQPGRISRRRQVLFDCSPNERSDIRGLRICYGSRISLRSCGLLAGVWGRRDRETEGGGCYLIVARMSAATSGVFAFAMVPAYRCAHAGYLLRCLGATTQISP